MGRAGNPKGKSEENEDVEELKPDILLSSGDVTDEEANEDLSLNIVERWLLTRAAQLADNDYQDFDFVHDYVYDNINNDSGVLGVYHGGDGRVVGDGLPSSQDAEAVAKKKRKKKNKIQNIKTGDQYDASSTEVDVAGTQEKMENSKAVEAQVEIDENVDPTSVQTTDNVVLRKLLRGRRYFDPPDSGWLSCYNCGEDGHIAVNCPASQKKKKPCFLCGSLEHGIKQCSKERICSICKTAGHRPKNCPEKHKGGPLASKVCLKCGDSGHGMFSCEGSYTVDDLKEIQCYICKRFGHVCCVNTSNNSPTDASCYKCGEQGHTGLECSSSREETITKASPNTSSSCSKCGEGGHFAHECRSSVKAGRSNNEFSTPTLKPHRENKEAAGLKSAPEMGKHCRRKTVSEEKGYVTPQIPKQRGGWIMDDPVNVSQSRHRTSQWASPSTPYYMDHPDFNFMPDGHSQSSERMRVNWEVQSPNLNYHHPMFNNLGNGVYRGNYGGW